MNNINEQFLEAMSTISGGQISKLKYDKTIKAEVYKLVDLDSGEYKVKYEGNVFSTYSDNLETTYKVGDSVFVTVPEGDFSNRKIITSIVSARSLSYNQMTQLQNSIFPVSPTLDQLYKSTKGVLYDATAERGVIAGVPDGPIVDNGKTISTWKEYKERVEELQKMSGTSDRIARLRKHFAGAINVVYEDSDLQYTAKYHGLFQQYARNYEYIRIRGSFLTRLHSSHTDGNYGIQVEFYAKNDGIVSYNLDLPSFNGSFYTFSVYTPQSIVIQTKKDYLLGLKSITLFEENFEYDRRVENGIETAQEIKDEPNIFCKDVLLDFVEVKDLTDSEYYLNIATPQGMAFTDAVSTLDLVGRLNYRGENILEEKTCTCQWFERDASVMVGHEKYNKDVGFGWTPIESDFNTLHLFPNNVRHRQKYKLLVIYNEKVKLTAEIEIFNSSEKDQYSTENYIFSLIQTTGTQSQLTNMWLELRKEKGSESLYGNWYIAYPDGAYEEVYEGMKTDKILIDSYLIYSPVTFYCSIYTNSGLYLGTLEHNMSLMESGEDVTIKYIGEDIYRYDANGDVTYEDAEKERTLAVELTWKEETGASYYVTWIMRDLSNGEIEIPIGSRTGAINPPSSMVENVWVDNYNILHYTIKQKYSINNANNLFIVKIRTAMDDEYFFEKEILFIKDGDQGTNGTTYIAAIRPCDTNGTKLSGLQPLIYNGGWIKTLPLKCYVYKDGEPISNLRNITARYKWESVNVSFEKEPTTLENQVVVKGNDNSSVRSDGQYYIKVQVTINDRDEDREVDIYALYPIDVLVGTSNYKGIDVSDIPSYIKYTASGINPSFYSNSIHFYYNGTNYSSIDKVPGISSIAKDVLQLESKDDGTHIKPAASYIFESDTIAALKCSYTSSQYLIHPIILFLDTYGNEAINGWDGTKLYIDPDGEKYLFAPQIGAGEKDSFNRFTGVVMGKYNVYDTKNQEMPIGLYGFKEGINTFGLMDSGRAFFGAKSGGGQIVIDGKHAVIFGGDVTLNETTGDLRAAANGMYLRLADKNPDIGTKAIGIGWSDNSSNTGNSKSEENFYVTYDGIMKATEADIHGTIYAYKGVIGGEGRSNREGKDGGWVIENGRIHSYSRRNNTYVELNSQPWDKDKDNTQDPPNAYYAIWSGNSTPSKASFWVSKSGLVHSTAGEIGGWTINETSIANTNDRNIGMSSRGSNAFWASSRSVSSDLGENYDFKIISNAFDSNDNKLIKSLPRGFLVTKTGYLYCSEAFIRGTINAEKGIIGGWTIASDRLKSSDGSVYLSTSGLKLGNFNAYADGKITIGERGILKFTVDKDGKVTCSDIDITGGTIKIGDNFFVTSSGVTIGSRSDGYLKVDSDGYLTIRCGNFNLDRLGNLDIGDFFSITKDGTLTCRKVNQLDVETSGGLNVDYVNIQNNGMLGTFDGNDGYHTTTVIGIKSDRYSVVLESSVNARLSASGSIILQGNSADSTLYLKVNEIDLSDAIFSGFNAAKNYTFIEGIIAYAKQNNMIPSGTGGTT